VRYHLDLEPRQVPKFRRAALPNSEVISAPLLHFKPIFDAPLKKVVRRAPVPGGGCASKTWSFSSACKNLGAQHPLVAEIWSSENCALRGYDFTFKSPRSLDQTSPYLFLLNIFIRFGDIRRRTSKSSEIGPNFACFLPLNFFWGASAQKILDRHYKIRPSTDHRAKFHAGRPTLLRDFASGKK